MRRHYAAVLSAALFCLLAGPAAAQLHPPELKTVFPLGGRPGATTRVTIGGLSFRGATGIVFDAPGITGKIVSAGPAGQPPVGADSDGNPDVVADITVAPDAAPAVYQFRLICPAGVSNVGKWIVGRAIPDIDEKEPNNGADHAQSVALPVAINGHIDQPGDLDTFAFDLQAGKTFVAEAMAAAADSPLDTLLTLRDGAGREIASNDDYNGPDSLIIYPVTRSGRYLLTIASSVQSGGPDQAYRLSIGYLPLLQAVYPTSAPPGRSATVQLIGVNLSATATVTAADGAARSRVFDAAAPLSNALPLARSPLPLVEEREPNDDMAHATPMSAPGVACGRFYSPREMPTDVDYFRFHAEAGRRFLLDAQCQAIGTRGDPILTLFDSAGKQLAENDDAIGKDSRIDFTFPAAGDYYLRVKDVPGRSAPDLAYRLMISDPPPPGFSLSAETRGRVVGRGERMMLAVDLQRDRWDGPVTLAAVDLPRGVSATTVVVPPGAGQGLLFLSADTSAPMGGFPLHIVGRATVNGKPVTETLTRAEDWVWHGGPRANAPVPAELVLCAVGMPFEVAPHVDESEITLARGKSVKVKVKLEKRAAYKKAVDLIAAGLPAGVTAEKVTVAADKTSGELELKAAADAKNGAYIVALDALVTSMPEVVLDRVTGPITLRVVDPPPAAPPAKK